MLKAILVLITAVGGLSVFASERSAVSNILAKSEIVLPDNFCPECGLDLSGLDREASKLKIKIEELARVMSGRLQTVSNDSSKLTDIQIASQARDQIALLFLEVSRQKILARKVSLELETCRKVVPTGSGAPPKEPLGVGR